jgi:hypothetical protein
MAWQHGDGRFDGALDNCHNDGPDRAEIQKVIKNDAAI